MQATTGQVVKNKKEKSMRIVIYGAGAIGGVVGGYIGRAGQLGVKSD
jgi:hypothetical protein